MLRVPHSTPWSQISPSPRSSYPTFDRSVPGTAGEAVRPSGRSIALKGRDGCALATACGWRIRTPPRKSGGCESCRVGRWSPTLGRDERSLAAAVSPCPAVFLARLSGRTLSFATIRPRFPCVPWGRGFLDLGLRAASRADEGQTHLAWRLRLPAMMASASIMDYSTQSWYLLWPA